MRNSLRTLEKVPVSIIILDLILFNNDDENIN